LKVEESDRETQLTVGPGETANQCGQAPKVAFNHHAVDGAKQCKEAGRGTNRRDNPMWLPCFLDRTCLRVWEHAQAGRRAFRLSELKREINGKQKRVAKIKVKKF